MILFERDGSLWILEPAQRERCIIRDAHAATWSGDGKRIAFVRGNAIWWTEIANTSKVNFCCDLPPDISANADEPFTPTLSWHPQHNTIAFSAFVLYSVQPQSRKSLPEYTQELGSIWTVDTDRGQRKATEADVMIEPTSRGLGAKGMLSASHPAWDPRGATLAFARGGELALARIQGSDARFGQNNYQWDETALDGVKVDVGGNQSTDLFGITSISWHPSGRSLVCTRSRWNGQSYSFLEVYSIRSQRIVKRSQLLTAGNSPVDASFSPDGASLLSSQFSGDEPCIFEYGIARGTSRLLVRHGSRPIARPQRLTNTPR